MTTVYLDIETTGLDGLRDEIVQIAIVDDNGDHVLYSHVKPVKHSEWPDAEGIHGISPEDVADAPTLDDLRQRIIEAITDKTVVVYNRAFERDFLGSEFEHAQAVECCMLAFAEIYGDWHDYHHSYTWQPLSMATMYIGFEWGGDAHDAFIDALATRAVWAYCTDPIVREVTDWEREENEAAYLAGYEIDTDRRLARYEWRKYRDEMSDFWMKWLRFPLWQDGKRKDAYLRHGDEKRITDELTHLFTGRSVAVHDALSSWPEATVYEANQHVPDNLKTMHGLGRLPRWIKRLLEPNALAISKNGKKVRRLYDQGQPEAIRKRYPPRYAYRPYPKHLFTRTALKKRGVPQKTIRGLEVKAQYYQVMSHQWIDLFEIPAGFADKPD